MRAARYVITRACDVDVLLDTCYCLCRYYREILYKYRMHIPCRRIRVYKISRRLLLLATEAREQSLSFALCSAVAIGFAAARRINILSYRGDGT